MTTKNKINPGHNPFSLGTKDDIMPIPARQDIQLSRPAAFFQSAESPEYFTLDIPAVGYEKEEIEIFVINGLLRVSANKKRTSRGHHCAQIIEEIDTDSIERLFKLADFVQHEHIDATYQNDVIHLSFTPGNEKDIHQVDIQ